MATEIQPPSVLAMVVCDGLHRDPSTGKFIILGTFNEIKAIQFPARHELMAFYIAITDAHGKLPLKLSLVSADEEVTIGTAEMEISVPDPIVVVELPIAVQNLVFPVAGEYRVQLFCGGEHLMERRIMVTKIPSEKGDGHDKGKPKG